MVQKNSYDAELEELKLELIRMGAMAEQAILDAMRVLNDFDMELIASIMENDDVIDEMARRIESRSMKLIMKRQPVAGDLRTVSAALKMVTDLERIGDQAADIAEISKMLRKNPAAKKPAHISAMENTAVTMVHAAVDCYVNMSVESADKVIEMDDTQDGLFNKVKEELIDLAIEDRKNVDAAVDYLMVAKYLERISDHAENIADWTLFAITGIHKKERIL